MLVLSVAFACGMLSAADLPQMVTTAKAGVFTDRETPAVTLEGKAEGVVWTLLDWRREKVGEGAFPASGRLAFPDLPRGYYFLQAKTAVTNLRETTFCIVADPVTRQFPSDSFYGVDAALSWVCSPEHYAVNWYGENVYAACLDLIRLAGLPHLRERLRWRAVSPRPGVYDGQRYLANARLARERGFRISGMFHDAASYAAVKEKCPTDLAAVWRFCRETVLRFGDAMGAWEFWNEPDIGFCPEPVWDYMSAMKAAYLGFRAANPMMPVLNGAVCNREYADFDEALFANDLAKYSNVFNFHTYHTLAGYPNLLDRQARFLERVGVPRRAVWVTEFGTNLEGHPTRDGLKHGLKAHSYEQEMTLAEVCPKYCTLHQMQGIARGYWFVFGAYNERNGAKDWGVQRRDGSVKPVYAAIATMTEMLVAARLEGELKVAEGARAFVYRQPDGSQTLVSWAVSPCDLTKDGSCTPERTQRRVCRVAYSVAADAGSYQRTDWCGAKTTVGAKNGRLDLIADRYASYVDGLSGLKPDIPARARGKVETYVPAADEDLSVIFRIDFATNDFRVVLSKTAVETEGLGGRAKLSMWNLSDAMKTGRVETAGARLDGLPESIVVPPMGSAAFDVTLVYTNAAPSSELVVTGCFNGKRTSRLSATVRSNRKLLDACRVTNLKANDARFWTRNDSATRTSITWDEKEKAVRFDATWDNPEVDRWIYPVHLFADRAESFEDAVAIDFDVRMESNKMENDVKASYLMLIGQDGKSAGSQRYLAPNSNWERRRVDLTDNHGKPSCNGMKGFRLGCNPLGTRMTLWIKNLRVFRLK